MAARIVADEHRRGRQTVNVRVGGPNAGHTAIGRCPTDCVEQHSGDSPRESHPWRLRQVPVGAVTGADQLVIAAGSEVDPDVLAAELRALASAGYAIGDRLFVDRSATVLEPHHIEYEKTGRIQERLGSTAKGIGAARSDRIWRVAKTWGGWAQAEGRPDLEGLYSLDTQDYLADLLRRDDHTVVIEGTQGYGLGLHTQNYPYVTSGDCRAVDFMSQAGLSPWMADGSGWGLDVKVVLAVRPHPIRVAGNSGSLAGETTWEALGLPQERTTVTQKIRRVGEWDPGLVRAAIRANGGPRPGVVWLAMTMWDSVEPAVANLDVNYHGSPTVYNEELFDSLSPYLADLGVSANEVCYVGTGPATAIVNDRLYD